MGKIRMVYYERIDPSVYSAEQAGEFYFHFNVGPILDTLMEDSERYEIHQMNTRNQLIAEAIQRGEIQEHPDMSSVVLGISSIVEQAILIVDR